MTFPVDMDLARRYAEASHTSTCTIRAASTGMTTDPATGEVTDTPGAVIYAGKCRIRQPGNWGVDAEAGGEKISPTSFLVSVPAAVVSVQKGHVVTVDTSEDAAAVGRKFRVRFTPAMGDVTARRLICEEI